MRYEETLERTDKIELALAEKDDCEYNDLVALEWAKDALEKQIPKKPIGKHTDYKCPVCDRRVRSGKGSSSRNKDNY